ncbi:uncharacterized protein LOC141905230, partial [Tubulanus polymorphus]|uniref:uncharacterized protein LOC141905230 n=1 Tax=Tubulanus polymorphus TaxID=672921 RepID=UPI003DA31EA3
MNLETNKIITSELVQSNEVTSSNAMELEGLKRCAEKLKKFKITALVTDMHFIECFHNILNHFAPKMIHFSYVGMLSRICIAILHYNGNSER